MSDPLPIQHVVIDERGRAHISGSRIKIVDLVAVSNAYGWGAEELARQYPHLSLGKIHAALSYYHD